MNREAEEITAWEAGALLFGTFIGARTGASISGFGTKISPTLARRIPFLVLESSSSGGANKLIPSERSAIFHARVTLLRVVHFPVTITAGICITDE